MGMGSQVLHIDCPDEKGLVYRITEVLYKHGLNIVSNQEFVDAATSHFVMRTEFEGSETPNGVLKDLKNALPGSANIRQAEIGGRSMVLMATKDPHCLGDLLLQYRYGEIPAHIDAVISNYDELRPLADSFDMPFHGIQTANLSRREHEEKLQEVLARYKPDYIVLAKYMRVLTPDFVSSYKNRIINIHHSFYLRLSERILISKLLTAELKLLELRPILLRMIWMKGRSLPRMCYPSIILILQSR